MRPNYNAVRVGYLQKTRQKNYKKVLLAVYFTADPDGLASAASNAEIAEVAGLSAGTVQSYLRMLHRDGHIAVIDSRDYDISFRQIVLMDHLDAHEAIAEFDHYQKTHAWRM